jgi:hypothetical protein
MGFSSYKSYGYQVAIPKIVNSIVKLVDGFTFRVFSTTSTVPVSTEGKTLINNGNVVMYQDLDRGYVFQFNGSNYLQINLGTPIVHTKTFWVSFNESSSGQVFSSGLYALYYGFTDYLHVALYTISNGSYISNQTIANYVQGRTWAFYAITGNSTGYTLYINGEKKATKIFDQGDPAWNVDTNIQFGAQNGGYNYKWFLDDMRLYPFMLTDNQIMQIYNGG